MYHTTVDSVSAHLDNEVHVAMVVVTGDGCVGSDHEFAVDTGSQVDVLAWQQINILHINNTIFTVHA